MNVLHTHRMRGKLPYFLSTVTPCGRPLVLHPEDPNMSSTCVFGRVLFKYLFNFEDINICENVKGCFY